MGGRVSTLLDLLGVAALAGLAWFVWPPLVLGVIGVAALLVSWQLSREGEDGQ